MAPYYLIQACVRLIIYLRLYIQPVNVLWVCFRNHCTPWSNKQIQTLRETHSPVSFLFGYTEIALYSQAASSPVYFDLVFVRSQSDLGDPRKAWQGISHEIG